MQKYKDEFRAHIQFRDEEGKKTNIRGPLRATEKEAYDDLEDIRASGGLGQTRGESFRIMMAEANQQKAAADDYKRLRESGHGSTEEHKGECRAHLQFRDETNSKVNMYGVTRAEEDEAQNDLDRIRAAGSVATSREEGIKLMEAEAIRIKKLTEYQSEIQQTIERALPMILLMIVIAQIMMI